MHSTVNAVHQFPEWPPPPSYITELSLQVTKILIFWKDWLILISHCMQPHQIQDCETVVSWLVYNLSKNQCLSIAAWWEGQRASDYFQPQDSSGYIVVPWLVTKENNREEPVYLKGNWPVSIVAIVTYRLIYYWLSIDVLSGWSSCWPELSDVSQKRLSRWLLANGEQCTSLWDAQFWCWVKSLRDSWRVSYCIEANSTS